MTNMEKYIEILNSSYRVKHWGIDQMNANYSAKKYIAQMIKDWNIREVTSENGWTISGFPVRNGRSEWN